jgi:hypothetical protein
MFGRQGIGVIRLIMARFGWGDAGAGAVDTAIGQAGIGVEPRREAYDSLTQIRDGLCELHC